MINSPLELETISVKLCKSCGLCCTGHLFLSVRLSPAEINDVQSLGLNILQSNIQDGQFWQPCPLWNKLCTIYDHPSKPSKCSEFKCKLFLEVDAGQLDLRDALGVIRKAKEDIHDIDEQLPKGGHKNFLIRLYDYLEHGDRSVLSTDIPNQFRLNAGWLLVFLTKKFGVTYFFDKPERK